MAKTKLKCPKCDRTFNLKAHLARHMSASHGIISERAAAKRRGASFAALGRVGKVSRREAQLAAQYRLNKLPIEDLTSLMDAVKAEAQRRIAEIQKVML